MEGVIRFKSEFSSENIADLIAPCFKEIAAWRRLMYLTGLIGQDPNRYGGFGYGNISRRYVSADFPHAFMISGSQTGHLPDLEMRHYTLVTDCYSKENRVKAKGLTPPSSESMTHGMIYAIDDSAYAVIHAHSPQIWHHAKILQIPAASEQAGYGTPEMTSEIERLFAETRVKEKGIFAMGGHEDGIVSFGKNLETAGCRLISHLALALQLF